MTPKPSPIRIVAAFAALALGVGALILFAPSCDGYEDDVIAMVRACPLAAEALGANPERRRLGIQLGSSSGRGSKRWVKQDVLVRGARAEGTVEVDAHRHQNIWTVRTAVLRAGAGSRPIELTRCGFFSPRKMQGKRMFSGIVKAASQHTSIRPGDACRIEIQRTNDGEECRATVECKGAVLYGSTPENGYNLCGFVETQDRSLALVALDMDRRLSDTEPTLRFDERTGELALATNNGGAGKPWSFTAAMEKGATP